MEPPGVAVTLETDRRERAPSVPARLVSSVVVAVMLMAACTGPGGSPARTGSPSLVATPGSTAPDAPTAPPEPTGTQPPGLFRVVGDEPVIPRGVFEGRSAILPGAIAVADGTYHAWVVAFAGIPGTQDVHHLTSPDAVAWTEVPDPSLERLSAGLGDPGALPTSALFDDGTWVMYVTGTLATEREAWQVWRATAPSPDGPWTRTEDPVLRRGPAGAWDAGGLDFPTVARVDDGYVLLYAGIPSVNRETGALGLATSQDGVTWTKHDDPATTDPGHAESDPVLEPGLCGGFDARAVHQPRLVAREDGLLVAYAGYAAGLSSRPAVGLARSDDGGRTWLCAWPGPALDPAGLPEGSVHTMVAFPRGDRVGLLVEWIRMSGTDVWLAEADGLP